MKAQKHCRMIYRFDGMARAYDFRALLRGLALDAEALYSRELGWYVETDTRCLDHAVRIAPFIYKGGK